MTKLSTVVLVCGLQVGVLKTWAESSAPETLELWSALASRKDRQTKSEFCERIASEERGMVARQAGADVVEFAETIARALARSSNEERLQVMAEKFDHLRWQEAAASSAELVSGGTRVRERVKGASWTLEQAAAVLAHYGRTIENSKRQVDSALRAFRWNSEQEKQLRVDPIGMMATGWRRISCMKNEKEQYGCRRGEDIYLVRILTSPLVACRFPDKMDSYSSQYWVRVGSTGLKIVEIEISGVKIARQSKDELVNRYVLTDGSSAANSSAVLTSAGLMGLESQRVLRLWRRWTQPASRLPASTPDH